MDKELLSKTAAAMVAKGKGILAADESSGTCEKRFRSVGAECSEENRRSYRGLLFATPGVEQYLSGVILFDETARQKAADGIQRMPACTPTRMPSRVTRRSARRLLSCR